MKALTDGRLRRVKAPASPSALGHPAGPPLTTPIWTNPLNVSPHPIAVGAPRGREAARCGWRVACGRRTQRSAACAPTPVEVGRPRPKMDGKSAAAIPGVPLAPLKLMLGIATWSGLRSTIICAATGAGPSPPSTVPTARSDPKTN